MLRRAPVPILLLGVTLASPVLATDLTAIADTYTQSDSPTSNFGSSGITAVASNRTTLLRFDAPQVAQSSGARATLKVKLLLAKNSQDGVSARLVSGAWDEKSVTAKTLPPISTAALDGIVISRTSQGQLVTFDVSGALAGWRSNPASNFGIALVPTTPTPNLQLGSREGGAAAVLSIAVLPQNEVTVALSGGDYSSPQAAANNAFQGDKWCVSPTASKPCTIHVAAGIYPNASVTLPRGLSLIGAAKAETILIGGITASDGLISDLTVTQGLRRSGGQGLLAVDSVSISSSNVATTVSFKDSTGQLTFTDSEIYSHITTPDLPATTVNCGSDCGSLKFIRCHITSDSPSPVWGISFSGNDLLHRTLELEDTSVFVSSPSRNGDSYAISVTSADVDLTIVRGTITAVSPSSGSFGNFAVNGFQGGPSAQVIGSVVNGGIQWFASGSLLVDGSVVNGFVLVDWDHFFVGHLPVSILRSQLGALIANNSTVVMENSVVLGSVDTFFTNATLTSSEVGGPLRFNPEGSYAEGGNPVATCTRVFNSQSVLYPADCGPNLTR